ncbi:ATP binding protein [Heracleum sosnowskyi]|uniref:ATP binding protein n=1 Tax=Heracleum sosnowskyi TaxID=360622 RepID=A0AAD8N1X6_9APIA|nr:ATP binding protein [Heracleum sosnowskyi]
MKESSYSPQITKRGLTLHCYVRVGTRMDMHIHMSYCTPCGFKLLATNYLGVRDHMLFQEIEELIPTTKVTPAEVAEQLLQSDEADVSLASLLSFLHTKSTETEEGKAKKETDKVIELVSEAAQDR